MTDLTNAWLQFLSQHGAQLHSGADGLPGVAGFADEEVAPSSWVTPLTDLGLIGASGEEAAHFLHNQLTNDVEHLGETEARLAGYCSPKGRLLATLLMWKSPEAIVLQVSRDVQAMVQKRLQMFVLRAKVKLADLSDSHVALGLSGPEAGAALSAWFPALPAAPWQKIDGPAGTLIRVADAFGAPRYQWICDTASAIANWAALTRSLAAVGPAIWRRGEIHAGLPRITKATQEQFVPQMLNFEVVGGVNFKKGCYPGQEVVARSQYLGKLKRRMMPASVAAEAAAGMEVFSAADPEQPCGMIVNTERNVEGGSDCLVELKLSALEEGTILLGSAQGPALQIGTLPYALP